MGSMASKPVENIYKSIIRVYEIILCRITKDYMSLIDVDLKILNGNICGHRKGFDNLSTIGGES